jgi:hypothetical protein
MSDWPEPPGDDWLRIALVLLLLAALACWALWVLSGPSPPDLWG